MHGLRLAAFGVAFLGLLGGAGIQGQEKKAIDLLTVVDGAGKEISLARWKIVLGTESLPWKEDAKGKSGGDEYLAFRDDGSTSFVHGIVSYIPVSALAKINYDEAKKSVAVAVRTSDKEVVLSGTTKFKGINKLTVEGETDLAGLGKAIVKHHGGQPKGIAGLRFPAGKPVDAVPPARAAVIAAEEKDHPKHAVVGLEALYKVGTATRAADALWFKETVKIDLDKIVRLKRVEPQEKKAPSNEFEVTLKDGAKHSLILNDAPTIDGKQAKLVGLFGRVATGWKLFPPHAIAELSFEDKDPRTK